MSSTRAEHDILVHTIFWRLVVLLWSRLVCLCDDPSSSRYHLLPVLGCASRYLIRKYLNDCTEVRQRRLELVEVLC